MRVPDSSPEAFETLVRDALDTLPDWLAPYLARISVQIDDLHRQARTTSILLRRPGARR